jgi:hypothetical protein
MAIAVIFLLCSFFWDKTNIVYCVKHAGCCNFSQDLLDRRVAFGGELHRTMLKSGAGQGWGSVL